MIVRGRFLCPKRVEDVNYVTEFARDFYTKRKIDDIEAQVIKTVTLFKSFAIITTNQLMWMVVENVRQINKNQPK